MYLGRRMCRFGENDPKEVLALMQEYGISARLTFSNLICTIYANRNNKVLDIHKCLLFTLRTVEWKVL